MMPGVWIRAVELICRWSCQYLSVRGGSELGTSRPSAPPPSALRAVFDVGPLAIDQAVDIVASVADQTDVDVVAPLIIQMAALARASAWLSRWWTSMMSPCSSISSTSH